VRHIALTFLIVPLLAALQSDAQDVEPPRRLDPPATATPLEENAETKSSKNESPDSASRKYDDVTKLPFSFTPADNDPAPVESRPPEAVQLFHCDFGPTWDRDFDNWPDRWSREQSVNYPHYVKIRIVDDALPNTSDESASKDGTKASEVNGKGAKASENSSPADENASDVNAAESDARCLQVDLDGGGAAVHCPPVKVDAMYTYVVEGRVQTEGLKHDEAFLSLTFLDAANKPLQTIRSDGLRRTTNWTKVRIGPIAATNKQAHSAVITLHLSRTEKADLNGTARFADIWLGRLPRMTLSANRRSHLYFEDETPAITCTASGFAEAHAKVVFELLDVDGNVVNRSEERLVSESTTESTAEVPQDASDDDAESAKSGAKAQQGASIFAGSAIWEPAIRQPGFYRVKVEMPGKTGVANQRQITLAVVRRLPPPSVGEFGWSLPNGEEHLTLVELAEVMGHSGCNWCKFPLWDESNPADREEQLVWFAERLGLRRVELVGMLSNPPENLRKQLIGAESQQAAGIFSMPNEMWYPSLEPIMTRLSLKVRWWQLGLDRDQSFVGYPELGKKIALLKKQFARYGQRMYLGMGWAWLKALPDEKPTWDFLSLSAEPPLTWDEQIAYLRATKGKDCLRWAVLDPLPRDQYLLETRATDLVLRMIACKMEGAEGVFVPEAFDSNTGLMNQDGTVGDLFIPWRTAAHLLAGMQSLGSLQLPSNSRTQVFQRGEEMIMAVWNDQPTELRLFLGEDVRQIDLWGRESAVRVEKGQQVIQVGATPIFVTGISAPLVRMQMDIQFENTKLASQFGKPQPNGIRLRSHFPQSIRGQVRVITPSDWSVPAQDIGFKCSPHEATFQQFEVTLGSNASTGRQLVRLDFDIMADRRYQFSVYRHMEVGLSDIYGEALTRLNEKGELEVEQRITNETDEIVSFKCYLYPGKDITGKVRKRMMMHIEDHGRGVDVRTFRIQDGAGLLNQTLFLRAEEINGSRILNFNVLAQP
jgi:hypothetical protein